MALGQWDKLETGVLLEAIEAAIPPAEGSELNLLGMIGALARFGSKTEFPRSLKKVLKKLVLNLSYWPEGLRSDGPRPAYTSETQAILYHACEILAGQLYPEQIFTNSGKDGRWHRKRGEQLAENWLRKAGSQGLSDWDSTSRLAGTLVALSHLADLARTSQVFEMASVVMDELFFGRALNA